MERFFYIKRTFPPAVDAPLGEKGREEAVKVKEQAILLLGKVLAKHGFGEGNMLGGREGREL